jgi:hypothetical protein
VFGSPYLRHTWERKRLLGGDVTGNTTIVAGISSILDVRHYVSWISSKGMVRAPYRYSLAKEFVAISRSAAWNEFSF